MPATLQRLPAIPTSKMPGSAATEEVRTLIDDLIAEQKTLQTPIARYSEYHDREPDLAPHYRTLIPLSKPGEGEQYAFEVSLDRCTGCKACVSACHSLNGLDEEEAWRDTGVIRGGRGAAGWQQTITTACHHCADPGCMNGCPVGAYEKEPDTGIVRHLDDQCIGCSYCILKCPFDVPKYSKKRGIVRKCDMCHQRLAEGEAPACVQACPTEAIRIVKVAVSKERRAESKNLAPGSSLSAPSFLPGAPDPAITLPTTRYVGREVPESAIAGDRESLVPQHAHWPLVLMLVLTQAGIGLLAGAQGKLPLILLANVIFFSGMAASVLHLGHPLKAWRFFLGLRTSWLSREILAFSIFAPIPPLLAALPFLPDFPFKEEIATIATRSVLPVGLLAVFTSVMIYHDTRRTSWRLPLTATRFFGSVATFAALALTIAMPSPLTPLLLVAAVIGKMIPEIRIIRRSFDGNAEWTPDIHSARLQRGPLAAVTDGRSQLPMLAIAFSPINPWISLPLLLAAEILERQLFFQSVHAPKMPGNFGPARQHR